MRVRRDVRRRHRAYAARRQDVETLRIDKRNVAHCLQVTWARSCRCQVHDEKRIARSVEACRVLSGQVRRQRARFGFDQKPYIFLRDGGISGSKRKFEARGRLPSIFRCPEPSREDGHNPEERFSFKYMKKLNNSEYPAVSYGDCVRNTSSGGKTGSDRTRIALVACGPPSL